MLQNQVPAVHALYGVASALPAAAQHSHAKTELLRLVAALVRGGALGRACGSLAVVDAWEQRQAVSREDPSVSTSRAVVGVC